MPCEIYRRLEQQIKHASDDVLHWRTESTAFRGSVSERRRKNFEKASEKLGALTNKRFHHARSCEECKKHYRSAKAG